MLSIHLALAAVLLTAGTARAQLHPSLCADCHIANQGKPNPLHLLEWDNSPHQRAGVGCENCHGGDAHTVDSFQAHRFIVRGEGPETPVDPASLLRTCGRCHQGPAAQFRRAATPRCSLRTTTTARPAPPATDTQPVTH